MLGKKKDIRKKIENFQRSMLVSAHPYLEVGKRGRRILVMVVLDEPRREYSVGNIG